MGKKIKIKLETGTVYPKNRRWILLFRYQVIGERKCVSLKTTNQKKTWEEAQNYLPIVQSTTADVISAM